jgi:cytochrome P450
VSDRLTERARRFPAGAGVTLDELEVDPYPVFARLRDLEPVTWIGALDMWYVTRFGDVRDALLDPALFTTNSPRSTIVDTFGEMMLTTEGDEHIRYRRATQPPFAATFIRAHFELAIGDAASALLAEVQEQPTVELRRAFASRLPVQTMLIVCGLPLSIEPRLRLWYDSFERALANFSGDPAIRSEARASVTAFHEMLRAALASAGELDPSSLLRILAQQRPEERLSDDEILRNLSIIFFGGISTVEGLLLNALWALHRHPAVFARVRADLGLLPQVIDETMRWLGPVQSATRHVTRDVDWRGATLRAGEAVNCMLGAANHDPSAFPNPDSFDIDRPNIRHQLGFAAGPHSCLGFRLAKAEAVIGLRTLLSKFPRLTVDPAGSMPPTGYEFRQPRRLVARLQG